jgi:hypothetical protein
MGDIKTLPVSSIDVLNFLVSYAKKYVKEGKDSVKKNRHMNELEKDDSVTQQQVEAVVVDFINYIGVKCGIDYALYTSDVQEGEKS